MHWGRFLLSCMIDAWMFGRGLDVWDFYFGGGVRRPWVCTSFLCPYGQHLFQLMEFTASM